MKKDNKYFREWHANNPGKGYAAIKKWRESNREKHRAYSKLAYAIKCGKVEKAGRCAVCRSNTTLQAHHSDYTKALDVKWLCKTCHSELHVVINLTNKYLKEHLAEMRENSRKRRVIVKKLKTVLK